MNRYYDEDKEISKEIAEEFGEGWLPPRPEITIPAPLAAVGDKVLVCNYRRRGVNDLDFGNVTHVMGSMLEGNIFIWRYKVKIKNKSYSIIIPDDKIIENHSK